MIIEVLSPSSPEYDLDIKLRAHEKAGVPEYAVVNVAKRRVLYYRFVDGAYGDAVTLTGEQLLSFACLPDIAVRVTSLFEGAPSTQT